MEPRLKLNKTVLVVKKFISFQTWFHVKIKH